MPETDEHRFIARSLDEAITKFSSTRLFGVTESQRRTFDYSCVLLRDFSRPLVSQVMWSHAEGIEKDIRTLLLEGSSAIKLYFVRDGTKARARIEEIVASYRSIDAMRRLLAGLRVRFVPADFDADGEKDREWLRRTVERGFCEDVLFSIVFGGLTGRDFRNFADHNGPLGLKLLVLDEVTRRSLTHMPTFKERIGYATSGPIREALIMLSALGLVRQIEGALVYHPTIKGRLLLDLIRRVLLETESGGGWSAETELLFDRLGVELPEVGEARADGASRDPVRSLVLHARWCAAQFGRDLLLGVDRDAPRLYSDYHLPDEAVPGVGKRALAEPESLLFIE